MSDSGLTLAEVKKMYLRNRLSPFSEKLTVDHNLALQTLRELRRIRYALNRLSPPTNEDRQTIRDEERSFETAFDELRSL